MSGFVSEYEYVLAWLVYGFAGLVACAVWWRMTRALRNRGVRDLLRGLVVVLVYTPWGVTGSEGYYAPALYVLVMELLLGEPGAGWQSALILLLAGFAMLIVLTVRILLRRRGNQSD